jgi:ParB-like chromosome segregation protein Spo0J
MLRVPVSQVKPAAYNPRAALAPGDPEYAKLKRSIEEFGLVDPLVWNKRTGNLVGGHQRLTVLVNEFGAESVDVSVVDVSPAKEKALNVALNKVAGRWDESRLTDLLLELRAGQEVQVTDTGFELLELEARLNRQAAAAAAIVQTPAQVKVGSYGVQVLCINVDQQRTVLEMLKKKGYDAQTCVL